MHYTVRIYSIEPCPPDLSLRFHRSQPGDKSSAHIQTDRKSSCPRRLRSMLFQCLLRSRIVTEHIATIPTIAQECQIDRSLCPCRRIADPGNEPDIAFPACKQSHLPDLAARKHDRLVPNGRNGFNHIAGRIREQLFGIHAVTEERGGKNYSRGDLVAPGSLTQPLRTEGHRGKVGRSGQIAGKRRIVLW